MKVYVDLIFILNFIFDSLILMSVSLILKRNIKFKKILLGSFIGSLTIFVLFISLSSIELFIIKILLSLIIIYITFEFKNIKYYLTNLLYFYTTSIVLGGFLYYINIELKYKKNGLVFYNSGIRVNIIFISLISPIILYLYIKQNKLLNTFFNKVYEVNIYLNNNKLKICGYFDTGNMLTEPYKKRKVIIVNKYLIDKTFKDYNTFYVPCKTINGTNIIECFHPDKVIINGYGEYNDLVIGMSNEKINIDGIECILNALIKEKK